MNDTSDDVGLEDLLGYLRDSRGFDFTGYKRSSLTRRIRRRMSAIGIDGFAAYREHLEAHGDEFGVLFNSVLINVTSFFRDAEAWGYLAEDIVPRVLRQAQRQAQIKIWSAGCASGEEPFSIAMLFAEAMGIDDYCRRAKVYATDWDEEALVQARRARYTVEQIGPVPEALRAKYFDVEDSHATFHSALRRSVIFGRHDLVEDPPISRLDLLLCRNTIMYFNVATQARILSRLHFALHNHGFLFLGRAEMLLSHTRYFTAIDLKHRVFSKVPDSEMPVAVDTDRSLERTPTGQQLHTRLREAALEAAPVAQIVVDAGGRLAFVNERAAAMFLIGRPELGQPLHDLDISYRPTDLRALVEHARGPDGGGSQVQVRRILAGGKTQHLDVVVRPLLHLGEHIATSITFDDVTRHHELRENLQRFSDNLETAYEELQSANEELETTNEELQAANEEMETVNEELRSTNEQLQAANEALRAREDELHRANTFLGAILGTLRAAVAVIGDDGLIKVWNTRAEELWGLRAEEVREMSFARLDIGLPVRELEDALAQTMQTGETREMTLEAVNRRGRKVRCHVVLNRMTGSSAGAVTMLMDVLADGGGS